MKSVFDLFKDTSGDQAVSYYQWNTSDDGRVRKESIVHSKKLLNFDWSRAVQLFPNCTL